MMAVRGGFCDGSFAQGSFGCGVFGGRSDGRQGSSGIKSEEWGGMEGIKCPKRYERGRAVV